MLLKYLHILWAVIGLTPAYQSRNRFWNVVAKWGYPGAVFLIIASKAILVGTDFLQTQNKALLSIFLFNLIAPVQFVLGFLYVRKKHFESVYIDIHKSKIRGEDTYQVLPNETTLVALIVTAFVVLTNIAIVLLGVGYPPQGFDLLLSGTNNHWHWLILTECSLNWLYSWAILVNNLVIFIYVFHKHLIDIRHLKEHVPDYIWKRNKTRINKLAQEVVGLRYTLNQSVDVLQEFYTSTTLLGSLAIGAIVEYRALDLYALIYTGMFIVLQLIFIYVIYQLSEGRQDILKLLKSPSLLYKYLTNVQCMTDANALRHDDTLLVRQDSFKISSYCSINNRKIDSDTAVNSGLETGGECDELLTLAYKNNASIDWIILSTLLSEEWGQFSLFGISFSDTEVIKKSIGIISVLVVFSGFMSSLVVI